MNSFRELQTHIGIKHKGVKFLTVEPSGNQFKMQIHESFPNGEWLYVGNFWRASDDQQFTAIGQGIYAGEVDANKLGADIADFLGLGKRVL